MADFQGGALKRKQRKLNLEMWIIGLSFIIYIEFDLDDFATIEEVEEGFRRMKLSNGATNTGKESVQY